MLSQCLANTQATPSLQPGRIAPLGCWANEISHLLAITYAALGRSASAADRVFAARIAAPPPPGLVSVARNPGVSIKKQTLARPSSLPAPTQKNKLPG